MISDIKSGVGPGHPIHTFVSEHEKILGFLDNLEKLNQDIQNSERLSSEAEKAIKDIAEHLIGAEPHHQREEEVLFPELEKREFSCAPEVMRIEHKELRKNKKELSSLLLNRADFNAFKKELNRITNSIIYKLRDHIFKEDNILYPTALQIIKDNSAWEKIKEKCDKIGYCCFTPLKGR